MPQNRPRIPADIERQVLIEAGHRCAVCGAELPLERAASGNLGLAYAALGETRRAIEFHEQDLAIAREISNQRGEAHAYWNLGLTFEKLGETSRAAEVMQVCVDYEREIGHPDAEEDAAYVERLRAGADAESGEPGTPAPGRNRRNPGLRKWPSQGTEKIDGATPSRRDEPGVQPGSTRVGLASQAKGLLIQPS
jgi:tetratricopeptide (TPR) repeat protein